MVVLMSYNPEMINRFYIRDGKILKRTKVIEDRLNQEDLVIVQTDNEELNEIIAYSILENFSHENKKLYLDLLDGDEEDTADICDEYLKVPTSCDDCFALGNNGICGYCRFTMNCYDGKDDLLDDNKLEDCPFRQS